MENEQELLPVPANPWTQETAYDILTVSHPRTSAAASQVFYFRDVRFEHKGKGAKHVHPEKAYFRDIDDDPGSDFDLAGGQPAG
ncbi:MAG: hypothetical protein P8129_15850, partial [Anaerolineae bacterium]